MLPINSLLYKKRKQIKNNIKISYEYPEIVELYRFTEKNRIGTSENIYIMTVISRSLRQIADDAPGCLLPDGTDVSQEVRKH